MGREVGRLIGLGHGGHTLSVGTEVDLIKTSYPPVCQEKKQMLDMYQKCIPNNKYLFPPF